MVNLDKFKESIQRFGGAMLVPVLMFVFFGSAVGITIVFTSFLPPTSLIYKIAFVLQEGSWTAFRQMPVLFAIGLPISLARKAHARAALEAFTIYMIFNYFVAAWLTVFPAFGVDMTQAIGGTSGLTSIGGAITLDTSIIGSLIIASIAVYLHNRYFDVKLPEALAIFQGTVLIVMIGFLVMFPLSLVTAFIWPKIQMLISSLQGILIASGAAGVWVYTFLERILIPTGLHHFIYQPFIFGPAVVDGGITTYWAANLPTFMDSSKSLRELFPAGGFALHGMSKLFAPIGISAAFYVTAKPKNRKIVLGILIPAALTAIVTGITEPFEFTFLFIAPILFLIHSLLAATLSTTVYLLGVSGNFGGGLIEFLTLNWIPLGATHYIEYAIQIVTGLLFSGLYFIIFRFLILKFNYQTPGRSDAEIKLYSKADYKNKQAKQHNDFEARAQAFLDLVGGPPNIETVANCATRLRLKLKDNSILPESDSFLAAGAKGLVITKNQVQIIVGLDVPQVREEFELLLKFYEKKETNH
ncbi:MAG: alpha-glucoside-specific PTS transporter subunit IIBC [Culicoidibacterales bacterium]